jgi:hypothetical protein
MRRQDGNERADLVVEQAKGGSVHHQILDTDTVQPMDGPSTYIIRCSCEAIIEEQAPTLDLAKKAAQIAWRNHAKS